MTWHVVDITLDSDVAKRVMENIRASHTLSHNDDYRILADEIEKALDNDDA